MNAVERSTEKVMTDLRQIVVDCEDLLERSAEVAGEKAQEARERLSATVETARRSCRRLEDRAREGVKAADQCVRAHSYEALCFSLASASSSAFSAGPLGQSPNKLISNTSAERRSRSSGRKENVFTQTLRRESA